VRAETALGDQINHNPKSPPLLTLLRRFLFLDGKYLNCAIAMKKADGIVPPDNRSGFTLALAYVIPNHRDWAHPELERLPKSEDKNPLYPA